MSVLLQPSPTDRSHPRPTRRPEIDGLRAVAVALVVLYHVTTGRVSGGVDVFLALSGFFSCTASSVRSSGAGASAL